MIYTAHHDHLGIGQPDANGDRIYNGAVDNAHRHRARDRAGARLRPRARGPTARSSSWSSAPRRRACSASEYYVANPLYPLGRTVGGAQHRRAWACTARRATSASRARPSSGCSTCWSPKGARAGPRASPPTAGPRRAASSARTISPSPRPAFRRFRSSRARTWSTAGLRAARRWREDYTAQALSPARRRISADWDLTGIVDDGALLHAVGRDLANRTAWPQLERGQRIPRRPRPERGRARRTAAPAPAPATGGEARLIRRSRREMAHDRSLIFYTNPMSRGQIVRWMLEEVGAALRDRRSSTMRSTHEGRGLSARSIRWGRSRRSSTTAGW